jgi:hypothetical protein
MELNKENKALFIAQYYGQTVAGHECDKCDFKLTEISLLDLEVGLWGDWSGGTNPQCACNDIVSVSDVWLNLKPLSSITDEDAIEVARIALYAPQLDEWNPDEWNPDEVWIGEGDIDNRGNHTLEVGMRCWNGLLNINDISGSITLHDEECEMQEIYNLSAIIDFLRSKGYALPWIGISVEDQVKAGWIKLINP